MTTISLKRFRRNRESKPVWMLRWFDSQGQHRAKTLGACDKMSRREAESLRREHQSKMDCGRIKADRPVRHTLAEYAAYDRDAIADRAPKTQLSHDNAVAHAKDAIGGAVRMDRIGRPEVARLKRRLQNKGRRPATIDKTLRTLRAMFNRALRDGVIQENPFAGERVRWDPKDSRIFDATEIDAMITVAPDDWWRCFIRLLSTSGLRLNEALHLRWEHVDLKLGVVRVGRQDAGRFRVADTEYPLLVWAAKAQSSYREIPLPEETVAALSRWKLKAGKSAYVFVTLERLRLIDRRFPDGIVEPNFPLMPTLHKKFDGIQKAARAHLANQRGVDVNDVPWRNGCFHDLRDTYLTSIKTVSVDVLKRLAGHSSLATTLKYYTSPTARDADAVRAALAEAGLSKGKGAQVQGTLRAHNADRSA